MRIRSIITLGVCLCFVSCFDSRSVSSTREDKRPAVAENQQINEVRESLDPDLMRLLKKGARLIQPFAWGSRNGVGSVVGIDEEGKLVRVTFANEGGNYVVKEVAPYSVKEGENRLLERSGSLELKTYLTDREFPFKSDIVSFGDCKIHFVLVHEALSRSFNGTYLSLTDVRLREITERQSQEISTFQEGPLSLTAEQTLVADINGDGNQDYVFIGSDMAMSIRIWTVFPDCTVKRIYFREGGHLAESEENKEVLLQLDQATGIYTVHSKDYLVARRNRQEFWKVTEMVYEWDAKESVYKKVKTLRRSEPIRN